KARAASARAVRTVQQYARIASLGVVLRKLLATGIVAVTIVAPTHAQPVQLIPKITYKKQMQFTPHGPVGFTVITGPPSGSSGDLYSLGPVLAGETIGGTRERVPDLERDVSATSTAVGINGDFTGGTDNHPIGIVVSGGAYQHGPSPARSPGPLDSAGGPHGGRISVVGTWNGGAERPPGSGEHR